MWRTRCSDLAASVGRTSDDLYEWWSERAAIRETEAGQPREVAEREAFEDLRSELVLATSGRKGPKAASGAVTDAARKTR